MSNLRHAMDALTLALQEALVPGQMRSTSKQDFDVRMMLLADVVETLSGKDRDALIRSVSTVEQHDVLDLCSRRMCAFAIREGQPEHLRRAAAIIALDNCGYDSRETLRSLAVLEYARDTLQVTTKDPVDQVADLASDDLRLLVDQWVKREPEMKRLDVLGMQTKQTADGVWFEPTSTSAT